MKNYPRVTEILRATASPESQERLRQWQSRQRAKGIDPEFISRHARETGTLFHQAIADYLLEGLQPHFVDEEEHRWRSALPHLQEIKHELLCIEQEVFSDRLGYVGHLDCLAWDGDNLNIIDWKTSARFKKKAWITDYFLQGAAYAIASYDCGVAPRLPDAIKIYVFSPQRTQVFVESVAAVGLKWIERLSQYNQLVESVA